MIGAELSRRLLERDAALTMLWQDSLTKQWHAYGHPHASRWADVPDWAAGGPRIMGTGEDAKAAVSAFIAKAGAAPPRCLKTSVADLGREVGFLASAYRARR